MGLDADAKEEAADDETDEEGMQTAVEEGTKTADEEGTKTASKEGTEMADEEGREEEVEEETTDDDDSVVLVDDEITEGCTAVNELKVDERVEKDELDRFSEDEDCTRHKVVTDDSHRSEAEVETGCWKTPPSHLRLPPVFGGPRLHWFWG